MIRSMTGYGKGDAINGQYSVTVEIKSVNHRFFECTVKSPRVLNFLDDKLKGLIQSRIARGKIDVFVTLDSQNASDTEFEINKAYLESYLKAIENIKDISSKSVKKVSVSKEIKISDLLHNSDILCIKKSELNQDEVWDAVSNAANIAIDAFVAAREIEGEKLKVDISGKLDSILEKVAVVEKQSPITEENHRKKIEAKIRELLDTVNIDEQRLLTETAIFADKIAVDEETVRLRSHISHFKNLLEEDVSVGKKLDFVVQEMNREANTMGSKCQDITIAHTVVDIKSEIEKIREQIQNIE